MGKIKPFRSTQSWWQQPAITINTTILSVKYKKIFQISDVRVTENAK